MIRIHGATTLAHDCRPRWLLNELGVEFELMTVDLSTGYQRKPEYLKRNPSGKVPFFDSPELRICESGAIVLYLADQYPEKGLAPEQKSPLRPHYYQWLFYAASTLEIPSLQLYESRVLTPNAPGSKERAEKADLKFDEVSQFLEYSLDGKRFLLGSSFSAADIMVGSSLYWAKCAGAVDRHPTLKRYMGDLMNRPGFKKTFGS